jgi:flagellar basal body-associated protein FliL|nr:smalltalk protein [uncultured Prevotella sp.]
MKLFKVNQDAATSSSKITWVSILNAIVQAIIAALTALGVSSCCN